MDERFQQDALAATDLLNMAIHDDSAFLSFLYAASGGMGDLPSVALDQSGDRRRVLGTYTAFQIIQNLSHREHSKPLQAFMSRLIEVIITLPPAILLAHNTPHNFEPFVILRCSIVRYRGHQTMREK